MPTNLQPVYTGPGAPTFPPRFEVLRLVSLVATVNGYPVYSAYLQQWDNRAKKLRDRLLCYWFEANKILAQPGRYVRGRLEASYQDAPLYVGARGCCAASSSLSSSPRPSSPSSSPSSAGFVTVPCCPNPLPTTLYCTWTNSGTCSGYVFDFHWKTAGSIVGDPALPGGPCIASADAWYFWGLWGGVTGGCHTCTSPKDFLFNSPVVLTCGDPTHWSLTVGATGYSWVFVSATCSPLQVIFTASDLLGCCANPPGPSTATVTA